MLKHYFQIGADQRQYDILQNIVAITINAYREQDTNYKDQLVKLIEEVLINSKYSSKDEKAEDGTNQKKNVLQLKVFKKGGATYSYEQAAEDLNQYANKILKKL